MKITDNKPHSIHLRLTDEQYDYCRTSADAFGVGVSEFIRIVVNATMVAERTAKEKYYSQQLGDLANNEDNTNNIEHQL